MLPRQVSSGMLTCGICGQCSMHIVKLLHQRGATCARACKQYALEEPLLQHLLPLTCCSPVWGCISVCCSSFAAAMHGLVTEKLLVGTTAAC